MDSSAIIDRLGGYRGLAEALKKPPAVVHHWIRRGVPAHVWPEVLKFAAAEGAHEITVEALRDASPGTPRSPRKPRALAGDVHAGEAA